MWRMYSVTIGVVTSLVVQAASVADYKIAYTDLSPVGVLGGGLYFTSGDQRCGSAGSYAMIWNGPSNTPVNLHPAGMKLSVVLAAAESQQAGAAYSAATSAYHAAIWSGTATSYRDLNPAWSSDSMAIGTTGTRQAGYATAPGYHVHAGVWSGTASSFVDLHPSGAISSEAYAIAGNQQAGMVNINGSGHAAIWSGTAASFLDLNPVGARSSEIWATTGNQQAGFVDSHAGIWFGTAQSFVDLNPAGSSFSEALATIDTEQSGFAVLGSDRHAILWFGAADAFIDLQLALGPTYRSSEAHSIWTDGSTIMVAGEATDSSGWQHPMLWTLTEVPEPGTASMLGLALLVWARISRNNRRETKHLSCFPIVVAAGRQTAVD